MLLHLFPCHLRAGTEPRACFRELLQLGASAEMSLKLRRQTAHFDGSVRTEPIRAETRFFLALQLGVSLCASSPL
jgi:hypothetical protein